MVHIKLQPLLQQLLEDLDQHLKMLEESGHEFDLFDLQISLTALQRGIEIISEQEGD